MPPRSRSRWISASRPPRKIGRASWPASHATSSSTSVGRRERKPPRNEGMAQNEQSRSQPSASLTSATGALGRGRAGKRSPAGAGKTSGSDLRPAGTSGGGMPPGEASGEASGGTTRGSAPARLSEGDGRSAGRKEGGRLSAGASGGEEPLASRDRSSSGRRL